MLLYTIGFSQKSAQQFFDLLARHKVSCMADIRLHPDGQLAGFTKKNDLKYFLKELIGCDYRHIAELTPTSEMFKEYHRDKDWGKLERAYRSLLAERGVPQSLDRSLFEENVCCLLCSEATPDHCHRRLAAETIAAGWPDVTIVHL